MARSQSRAQRPAGEHQQSSVPRRPLRRTQELRSESHKRKERSLLLLHRSSGSESAAVGITQEKSDRSRREKDEEENATPAPPAVARLRLAAQQRQAEAARWCDAELAPHQAAERDPHLHLPPDVWG